MTASVAAREWSTEDAAPSRRVAYWRETVGEAMLEMEIAAAEPGDFRARLCQAALGPLGLNFVETSAHEVRRTRQTIARSSRPLLFLFHLRTGAFELEQEGRGCRLEAGDCVLFDARTPYRFRGSPGLACLAVTLDPGWLARWLPAPGATTVVPLSRRSPWGAALTASLAALEPGTIPGLPLPGPVLAEQLAVLLALAAEPAAHRPALPSDSLLGRLRATLRERLHEADLDPAGLATAHGISQRYVHKLFAAAGTSFGRELAELRLERAKLLLDDPRFARLPVGELAWRCGFTDASHFARRFRRRFGAAPSAYRRVVHG
jgi:AraC-like DNA-binding protein